MESQTEIPDPDESGSDGSQVQADASNAIVEQQQQVGRPMANAITGLAASNSRAFGGEIASTLIAGATSQMAVELDQARQELGGLRKRNERLASDLSEERIRSAILVERIDAFRSSRHLKNIGVSVGALLVGLGVQLIGSDTIALGFAGLIIGAVLLLFSWASAPKEAKQ